MTDCTIKKNVQPMSTNLDTQCNQMFKQNIIHNNECNRMLESFIERRRCNQMLKQYFMLCVHDSWVG